MRVAVESGRVQLDVRVEGPAGGRPVLLLHGFPEGWRCWKDQIPALAAAGRRVWVPDQRGYGESDKPQGVAAYVLDRLAGDALELMALAGGGEPVDVVGHDWGAAVAWHLAAHHPGRLRRMVLINVPHPDVLRAALLRSPRQLLRSWYVFFFQLPWIAEASARAFDCAALRWGLTSSSRPGTFTEADLAAYAQDWQRPGALTAMISWYRAALRHPARFPGDRITVPTLLIWGARDRALGQELAAPSLDRCADGRLILVPEATHWVQHEEARRVNGWILDFLNGENRAR